MSERTLLTLVVSALLGDMRLCSCARQAGHPEMPLLCYTCTVTDVIVTLTLDMKTQRTAVAGRADLHRARRALALVDAKAKVCALRKLM